MSMVLGCRNQTCDWGAPCRHLDDDATTPQCEPQRLGTFRQQKERVPKHAPKLNFEIS